MPGRTYWGHVSPFFISFVHCSVIAILHILCALLSHPLQFTVRFKPDLETLYARVNRITPNGRWELWEQDAPATLGRPFNLSICLTTGRPGWNPPSPKATAGKPVPGANIGVIGLKVLASVFWLLSVVYPDVLGRGWNVGLV